MPSPVLPTIGPDLSQWGRQLSLYLQRNLTKLGQKTADDNPSEDGVILWDREEQQVVVSKDGEFVALRYGHSDHCLAYTTATHSAASSNTAYAITWESNPIAQHIAVDDSVTSRIVFDHAGTYKVDFSAELLSSSGSSKSIYIWPRINGVNIPFSTIVTSVKNNGDRVVVSRTGIFQVDANDYLEAYFAVDNTGLEINGSSATAFSPAAPSATIIITEVAI